MRMIFPYCRSWPSWPPSSSPRTTLCSSRSITPSVRSIWPILLTWGAFTYPVAFLVTDLANRRFGPQAARIVVFIGFIIAVALSIWLASPRIAIASGSAFLMAQLLDVSIFDRLRDRVWWLPPLVSTVIGSCLDTFIFFSLAFSQAAGMSSVPATLLPASGPPARLCLPLRRRAGCPGRWGT
jgi:uncharacterized PurR-regulated membrane protein YhhQ (DUF165 family)